MPRKPSKSVDNVQVNNTKSRQVKRTVTRIDDSFNPNKLPLMNPQLQKELKSLSPEQMAQFLNTFNTLYIDE